jgi:hypothetical protein
MTVAKCYALGCKYGRFSSVGVSVDILRTSKESSFYSKKRNRKDSRFKRRRATKRARRLQLHSYLQIPEDVANKGCWKKHTHSQQNFNKAAAS